MLVVAGVVLSGCIHETLFGAKTSPSKTMTETKVVQLAAQSNSGQTGTATLSEESGKVRVVLEVTSLGAVPQPAHIHIGSCPVPGAVKYPLTSVVNGKSETLLEVDMATLKAQGDLAVNVHKSAQEATVYTACGNL